MGLHCIGLQKGNSQQPPLCFLPSCAANPGDKESEYKYDIFVCLHSTHDPAVVAEKKQDSNLEFPKSSAKKVHTRYDSGPNFNTGSVSGGGGKIRRCSGGGVAHERQVGPTGVPPPLCPPSPALISRPPPASFYPQCKVSARWRSGHF